MGRARRLCASLLLFGAGALTAVAMAATSRADLITTSLPISSVLSITTILPTTVTLPITTSGSTTTTTVTTTTAVTTTTTTTATTTGRNTTSSTTTARTTTAGTTTTSTGRSTTAAATTNTNPPATAATTTGAAPPTPTTTQTSGTGGGGVPAGPAPPPAAGGGADPLAAPAAIGHLVTAGTASPARPTTALGTATGTFFPGSSTATAAASGDPVLRGVAAGDIVDVPAAAVAAGPDIRSDDPPGRPAAAFTSPGTPGPVGLLFLTLAFGLTALAALPRRFATARGAWLVVDHRPQLLAAAAMVTLSYLLTEVLGL